MKDVNSFAPPVRAIIAECLGCEPDEVTDDQNFFHDLGGESIDLLDMSFRIEKDLGIRINFQQMTSADGWNFDEQGRLSATTVRKLREEFPGIDIDGFHVTEGMSFAALLTVGFIIELVRRRAAAGSAA